MSDNTQQSTKDLNPPSRVSYLLRLWRAEGGAGFNWQASLENTETGKRIGFANLEQLFAYLMDLAEGKAHMQDTETRD